MRNSLIQASVLKAQGLTASTFQPYHSDAEDAEVWGYEHLPFPKEWKMWESPLNVKIVRWWWVQHMEMRCAQVVKDRKKGAVELHSFCFMVSFVGNSEEGESSLETPWVPLTEAEAAKIQSYGIALLEQMSCLMTGRLVGGCMADNHEAL